MQRQLKQLSDWLKGMEVKGHDTQDIDVINARQEVQEVTLKHSLTSLYKTNCQ